MIRRPTLTDVPDLARIHVQAWTETYADLLPASEHDAHGIKMRTDQWTRQIKMDRHIAYAPGAGFAQAGVQRDADLAARGYPDELYAIYVLDTVKGSGVAQDLFHAVRPKGPFTAFVLTDNIRAVRFYIAHGATAIEQRTEHIGDTEIRETVMAWD